MNGLLSVVVRVVQVRRMRVGVPHGLMAVHVAVCALGHGVMQMVMVAIVMGVGMLMQQGIVLMFVGM